MYLKSFVKAALAPIFTNFEGGARAEKNAIFLSTFFVTCFFLNFFFRHRKFGQNRAFLVFWGELRKSINLVDLKENVDKIFENF